MNKPIVYNYIFGPVFSGRLGRSLGLDLLGSKICSLNCLYCEAGATRDLTLLRKPYVSAEVLLAELRNYKQHGGLTPECITLGGMGEPCLNTELGLIIAGAKAIYPDIPVAVLTNSTLLDQPEVRQALMSADIVLPSMDTMIDDEFRKMSRPCSELNVETLSAGLLTFAKEYEGLLRLEILLLKNINDSAVNLKRLKDFIALLEPDFVDVVTMTRPGVSPLASPVDEKVLKFWQSGLSPLRVKPTGIKRKMCQESLDAPTGMSSYAELAEAIFQSLRRRSQTSNQLAQALDVPLEKIESALSELSRAGKIVNLETEPSFFQIVRQVDVSEPGLRKL